MPSRKKYLYQPYYCEENIWQLCQNKDFEDGFVVFISNESLCFPMLEQKAALTPSTPVFWDYHVVLLCESEGYQVFDFDTTLPFKTDLETYLKASFLSENVMSPEQKPLFRVVPAQEFIDVFVSDRSHMKTPQGWSAPPPNWDAIGCGASNLAHFIDMSATDYGEVLEQKALMERFRCSVLRK